MSSANSGQSELVTYRNMSAESKAEFVERIYNV